METSGAHWTAPLDAELGYNEAAVQQRQHQHQDAQLGFSPNHGMARSGGGPQDSANSSQQSLITRISPDPFSAPSSSEASSAVLLQRLYGSIGQFNHSSRSSLPEILEEPETDATPSAAVRPHDAAVLPSMAGAPVTGTNGTRALSDEDLFSLDLQASSTGGVTAQPAQAQPRFSTATSALEDDAESRTLFVRGINPDVTDQELREFFECFGDLRALLTSSKHRGFVVLSYHDIRAARLAQHTLQGQGWRGQQLSVSATQPKDAADDGASGTLLVVSLDGGRSVQDFYYVLTAYGELKELRNDPSRPNCCLAEYFDARHAAAALQGIAATPEISSRLLVLDAGSVAHPGSGGQAQGSGIMRVVGSSPAVMQLAAGRNSSTQLDTHSLLMGAEVRQGAAGRGMLLAGELAGMARSMSEMSLDASVPAPGGSMAGLAGLGTGSMSAGDLLGQGGGAGGGMYGMRGIASTGSMWQQATPGSLGTSPVGGNMWAGGGGMQDPMAAMHPHQAANAAYQQRQQRQQQGMLAQNAAVQAALQQALFSQQAAAAALMQGAAAGGQGPGPAGVPGVIGGPPRRGNSDPALGGRLARRPMDPVAEAERRAQQERLYSLDMGRISSGEDRRTTLMIKNIPNKYTQKMLLALIEDRFRGSFDFFYLPIDFKNRCNVGYAFINMVAPTAIPPLVEGFHGRRWPKFNSEKVCRIAYARIQGKAALVQHFQNSSLLHEDKRCRPVLFSSAGESEVFPGGMPGQPPYPPAYLPAGGL